MIVNTKDLKFYCLTIGDERKKINHIKNILKGKELSFVTPFEVGVDKRASGSIGHARMVEAGLRDQPRNRPFVPFVILEDDVSLYRDLPPDLDIPNDSDLFYLGISLLGVINGRHQEKIIANEIDENIVRVFNMLSGHAIMICSPLGASAYQKCMIDGYHQRRMWDIFAAESQPWYNVYAYKKPIFFQDAKFNGKERATRTELQEYDSPLHLTLEDSNAFTSGAAYKCASFNYPNLDFLGKLGEIPKVVHMSWRTKDFIHSQNPLVLNGVRNLIDMNPDWKVQISEDNDVDDYLRSHLDEIDYDLLKDEPMVPKTDVWRLLKICREGGIYLDIDRHCNKKLNEIIKNNVKCILPWHTSKERVVDFSQDIMISAANNPIHKYALELNLRRRRSGWRDILTLAPINYFHAVTKFLYGFSLNRFPSQDVITDINVAIKNSPYIDTFTEAAPHETLIFKFNEDTWKNGNLECKGGLYDESGVDHWANQDPIIRKNRKFD